MDKLSNFVTNPFVVLITYILTLVGVILALNNSIVLQIISVCVVLLCIIISTISFIRYRCDVSNEKNKIMKSVQKVYFNQANAGIENTMELVRTIVNNSLSMNQIQYSEDHFKSVCKEICSNIRILLSNICNIEFNVCIKQIITDELFNCNYSEAYTQTIARSGQNTIERSRNDSIPQKISENTSFSEILGNNNILGWASPNLRNTVISYKNAGQEYKNPDKNYYEYYNATLVVPIRISTKYMSPIIYQYAKNVNPVDYHYFAFLCVDSPREFDPEDEAFKKIAYKTLIACGDALYPLFENKLIKEIENI